MAAKQHRLTSRKDPMSSLNRLLVRGETKLGVFEDEMNWAWLSQNNHTCERMYEVMTASAHSISLGGSAQLTPHAIAAIWRIIHCRKCKFAYHPRIAAHPLTAEWYVKFGGDLKILYSKRPKTLIRDLPTIQAAIRRGVKYDPRLRYAQTKEDSDYLLTQLDDVAS
jgi:hypothetical protein